MVKEAFAAVDIGSEWKLAQFDSLGKLVSTFLPRILLLGGIIFFLLSVYAGFSFMTSAGSDDAQAKEKWRQILTYGVIGLIIMFGAFWVLQIINFILGNAQGVKGPFEGIL